MTEPTPEPTPDTEPAPEAAPPVEPETGPEPEDKTESGDNIDTEPELPDLPVEPARVQHPALDGDIQGEIEHRTPEPTGDGVFTKTFSVGVIGLPDDHPIHLANAGGVIQDAIQRGLHPKGDVMLVASEEHDDGRRSQYTNLTYQVPVVPAVVDTDAASTVTPQMIAEEAAERRQSQEAAVVGENGPEPVLPAGSVVEAPAKED